MRQILYRARKGSLRQREPLDEDNQPNHAARLALEESKKARRVAIASAILSALAIIASVGVFAAQQYLEERQERENQASHGDALIGMMGGFYNGEVEGMVPIQDLLAITIYERGARDRSLFAAGLERNARHHQALITDIREAINNQSSSPTYKTVALQMILLVRSIISLNETQAAIIREQSDVDPRYIGTTLIDEREYVEEHLRGIRLLVQVNAQRKGLLVGASCFAPPKGFNCDAPLAPIPGFSPVTPVQADRLPGNDG